MPEPAVPAEGSGHGAIARAVAAAAEGDTVLGGEVGPAVVAAAITGHPSPAFPTPTRREVEVLDLVARGLPNGEIAGRLFLSVKTVKNQMSALLAKTGAGTRAELVARARDQGLGVG